MSAKFRIEGLSDEDVTSLLNVRNFKYYCDTVGQLQKGECSFCVIDSSKNKIFYENSLWQAFPCAPDFQAENIEKHILITPKRHMTHISEMTPMDWVCLGIAIDYVVKTYNLTGGALVMRFGDPELNAGSVRHLHMNIIVPDRMGSYKVTLSKNPEDIEKKWKMIAVFEKLRTTQILLTDLTPEEQELVRGRI